MAHEASPFQFITYTDARRALDVYEDPIEYSQPESSSPSPPSSRPSLDALFKAFRTRRIAFAKRVLLRPKIDDRFLDLMLHLLIDMGIFKEKDGVRKRKASVM